MAVINILQYDLGEVEEDTQTYTIRLKMMDQSEEIFKKVLGFELDPHHCEKIVIKGMMSLDRYEYDWKDVQYAQVIPERAFEDIRKHQMYDYIKEHEFEEPMISIGNGPWSWKEYGVVIRQDISNRCAQEIIEDFSETNINEGIFRTVFCLNMLEHCEYPWKIIKSAYKILKEGGMLVVSVPFKVEEHNAPVDYWRFTKRGLEKMVIDVGFFVHELEYYKEGQKVRGIFEKCLE